VVVVVGGSGVVYAFCVEFVSICVKADLALRLCGDVSTGLRCLCDAARRLSLGHAEVEHAFGVRGMRGECCTSERNGRLEHR
jgi:hypothetical protein